MGELWSLWSSFAYSNIELTYLLFDKVMDPYIFQNHDQNDHKWTLTFRTEGDGPPPTIRIRHLLKTALRACGLRCVAIAQDAHQAHHEATGQTSRPSQDAEDLPSAAKARKDLTP